MLRWEVYAREKYARLLMSENKRKFSRIPVKFDAELTAGDQIFRVEEIVNLSMGGCLLPIQADLEPGTVCRLRILLNAAESEIGIEIDGQVNSCGV